MSPVTLFVPLAKLGPVGTFSLIRRKMRKRKGYRAMLFEVPQSKTVAVLKGRTSDGPIAGPREDIASVLSRADAMLRDENHFFSFPYHTKGIEHPWEYDPLENKYWPSRHYTERTLHSADTPRDVKIVWEINRFKDLPMLGQATLLTGEKKYVEEIHRRLLSWIEENPFASTIHWASALEISIRLLSWNATLILLREAGLPIDEDPNIARSTYEQARYLAGDLSTDKIIPTNHLIGEAAGLFSISTLWDFPEAEVFADAARAILEREILQQTFSDGVSCEASGWYHQFVTHFFDLAERVAARTGRPMSEEYCERLVRMKTYLSAIMLKNGPVRYGDADDGWTIYFEGDMEAWKSQVFGPASTAPAFEHGFFPDARHAAFFREDSFLFLRAGAFGMGGAGFSSHAHDDFLSPVMSLRGIPALVDPGTFVYNGDPRARAKYRGERAHNSLQIDGGSRALQCLNFGWKRVRPSAELTGVEFREGFTATAGWCGEWRGVRRSIALLNDHFAIVHDEFEHPAVTAEWRFHLHPMWKHKETSEGGSYLFTNEAGEEMIVMFKGSFESNQIEAYDFSPSYRVEQKALLVHLTAREPNGVYEIRFKIEPQERTET